MLVDLGLPTQDLSNTEAADDAPYTLSRQTQHFDAFLSHDWGTSRWFFGSHQCSHRFRHRAGPGGK